MPGEFAQSHGLFLTPCVFAFPNRLHSTIASIPRQYRMMTLYSPCRGQTGSALQESGTFATVRTHLVHEHSTKTDAAKGRGMRKSRTLETSACAEPRSWPPYHHQSASRASPSIRLNAPFHVRPAVLSSPVHFISPSPFHLISPFHFILTFPLHSLDLVFSKLPTVFLLASHTFRPLALRNSQPVDIVNPSLVGYLALAVSACP